MILLFLFLLTKIFNTLFLYFIFLPELGYMKVFSKFYSPVIYFTKSASAKITEIFRALKISKIALKIIKKFYFGYQADILKIIEF
jgi:hypothetical protein